MRDYSDVRWRNAGHRPRLGLGVASIDAWAFLAMFVFLLHFSWWTFYISIGLIAVFAFLEYLGFIVPVALRRARCGLVRRGVFDALKNLQ